jgi:hypothetical protein
MLLVTVSLQFSPLLLAYNVLFYLDCLLMNLDKLLHSIPSIGTTVNMSLLRNLWYGLETLEWCFEVWLPWYRFDYGINLREKYATSVKVISVALALMHQLVILLHVVLHCVIGFCKIRIRCQWYFLQDI